MPLLSTAVLASAILYTPQECRDTYYLIEPKAIPIRSFHEEFEQYRQEVENYREQVKIILAQCDQVLDHHHKRLLIDRAYYAAANFNRHLKRYKQGNLSPERFKVTDHSTQ